MLISTYPLLFAVALQAVLPAAAESPRCAGPGACESRSAPIAYASPGGALDLGGPTLSEFRSAYSGSTMLRSDAQGFLAFVATHRGQGRLLTGSDLRVEVAAAAAGKPHDAYSSPLPVSQATASRPIASAPDTAGQHAPRALRESQAKVTAHRDSLRRDSLAAYGLAHPGSRVDSAPDGSDRTDRSNDEDGKDSLILGGKPARHEEADHTRVDDDEAKGWFANLVLDWTDRGHGGRGGGMSGSDWAAIIYVVVGVVVVGAFIIYGVQTIVELAANEGDYPLFQELGFRLSYSGKEFRDAQTGPDMYRDAYLTGIRYAIGFDRPGMGMGLSVEGGYLDVKLRGISDPGHSFDFNGGYLVAGPLLRFGSNDPFSFSLEFLNGTSTHASIGWISKSRMTLQAKVGSHTLLGAHLGAVFYDLHFLDGLGWRQGNFNRDLSLIYGLDAGWEF